MLKGFFCINSVKSSPEVLGRITINSVQINLRFTLMTMRVFVISISLMPLKHHLCSFYKKIYFRPQIGNNFHGAKVLKSATKNKN